MLDKMVAQIDRSLADFLKQIHGEYQLHLADPILYQSIKDFVLRKGKRIRPILFILSYMGYRKSRTEMSPSIYYVSTCVELLHNFMLIHDDIIDRSDLRRGLPTMHRLLRKAAKTKEQDKLGSDLAIIVGDIIYASAFDAFLSINEDPKRKEEALRYFIRTAIFTAMGEFIDTLHGFQNVKQIKEKDVLLNYTLKTARYTFDCPLVVGAILAGAGKKDIRYLSELGLLLGQAFQIQDDIIGIFDTEKNIGKSILSDLAESKKTLLVCHAYRSLPTRQRKRFLFHFSKPKKNYQDLVAIRKIFLDGGSLDYTLQEIRKRLKRANTILGQIKMGKEFLPHLKNCVAKLFEHSYLLGKQYNVDIKSNALKSRRVPSAPSKSSANGYHEKAKTRP